VGLVFGQQDRTVGQFADVAVQGGEDLVAVGIATNTPSRAKVLAPGRRSLVRRDPKPALEVTDAGLDSDPAVARPL
jgi:hypothetical protein